MGELFRTIRDRVRERRYLVSEHALERLVDRDVAEWQVVDGIERGTLIVERPQASPNPAVEVAQMLADGTPVKAVWSLMIREDLARLVTVHFFDR